MSLRQTLVNDRVAGDNCLLGLVKCSRTLPIADLISFHRFSLDNLFAVVEAPVVYKWVPGL